MEIDGFDDVFNGINCSRFIVSDTENEIESQCSSDNSTEDRGNESDTENDTENGIESQFSSENSTEERHPLFTIPEPNIQISPADNNSLIRFNRKLSSTLDRVTKKFITNSQQSVAESVNSEDFFVSSNIVSSTQK